LEFIEPGFIGIVDTVVLCFQFLDRGSVRVVLLGLVQNLDFDGAANLLAGLFTLGFDPDVPVV
jgi:hypothetical protein